MASASGAAQVVWTKSGEAQNYSVSRWIIIGYWQQNCCQEITNPLLIRLDYVLPNLLDLGTVSIFLCFDQILDFIRMTLEHLRVYCQCPLIICPTLYLDLNILQMWWIYVWNIWGQIIRLVLTTKVIEFGKLFLRKMLVNILTYLGK